MTHEPPSLNFPPSSPYSEFGQEMPPPSLPPDQRFAISTPSSRPIITYSLMALNIGIFLLQAAGQALFGFDLVAELGMKINELILQGQFWRLFTPMFLHGNILHIGFNMYALYIFGPGLERFYGHGRFGILFLLSGIAGNVFSFMFSASPSLGSSTAIFGLLGAEGVFLYRNQKVLGGVARRALNNLVMIAIINLVIGLSPGIDNWGHLGGLLGGTIFAWLGGPILKVEGVYPNLGIVDQRETRDVFLAALVDIVIFSFLALGSMYLQGT